jgi:hypothetical protein
LAGRASSTALCGDGDGRPTDGEYGLENGRRAVTCAVTPHLRLLGAVVALMLAVSAPQDARGNDGNTPFEDWPRTTASLRNPGLPAVDVVHAAELDLAERPLDADVAAVTFARFLGATMSDPRIDLNAKRGAEILQCFVSESKGGARTFWSEFSLATFEQMAGDDRAAASTLARALTLAAPEHVPADIVARTEGLMGHAQQACGMLDEARTVFEHLKSDPVEQGHATQHLGEIALSTDGVSAGLDIWLKHPAGMAAGLAVVVDEADALWGSDPERSYRLVAEALARIDRDIGPQRSAGLSALIERLQARSRENAMSPVR